MSAVNSYMLKLLRNVGKVTIGKRYDYFTKDSGDEFKIYKRMYESKPWYLFCTVDKKDVNDPKKYRFTEKGLEVNGVDFVI